MCLQTSAYFFRVVLQVAHVNRCERFAAGLHVARTYVAVDAAIHTAPAVVDEHFVACWDSFPVA